MYAEFDLGEVAELDSLPTRYDLVTGSQTAFGRLDPSVGLEDPSVGLYVLVIGSKTTRFSLDGDLDSGGAAFAVETRQAPNVRTTKTNSGLSAFSGGQK
jgi:hypothetical protein